MAYKDPEKKKEKQKEYYEKNKEKNRDKEKKRSKEYYEKNKDKNREKRKEKQKEVNAKHYEKNKESLKEYQLDRRDDLNQHAVDSITAGEILDSQKWNLWCNEIKRGAKRRKHPYCDDFTNIVMFEMLTQGCFYCGDLATSIDRVDSKLGHTPENCVGSCHACNVSKSSADSDTFIRKAYYRARGYYYDDDNDIWYEYEMIPTIGSYTSRAKKKRVSFELSKKDFDELINGKCAYCHRSPTTWFGIDRKFPPQGYVIGNVVSCCLDCNIDKYDDDVETMVMRNERIANRVDAGELVIVDCDKVILHQGKRPSSQKVCVRGKVYVSKAKASNALGKCYTYVRNCISDKKQNDDIFEISNEFYEEYKDSEIIITKAMFIGFDHYYTNM